MKVFTNVKINFWRLEPGFPLSKPSVKRSIATAWDPTILGHYSRLHTGSATLGSGGLGFRNTNFSNIFLSKLFSSLSIYFCCSCSALTTIISNSVQTFCFMLNSVLMKITLPKKHCVLYKWYKFSKELSLLNKLWCSNPYIFSSQSCRPLIFQIMNYIRLNNPSLKY